MKLNLDVTLSPQQLAEAFCEMGDEEQAQFFIETAKISATWAPSQNFLQWRAVGKHLATCSCSSDEARAIVRDLADGLDSEGAA